MTKDDRLIMKFLGANTYLPKEVNCLKWDCENFPLLHNKLTITPCKFRTSFDWLMPVLKEIHNKKRTVELKMQTYENPPYDYITTISPSDVEHRSISHDDLLESTYNGVVEFIKWYLKKNIKHGKTLL